MINLRGAQPAPPASPPLRPATAGHSWFPGTLLLPLLLLTCCAKTPPPAPTMEPTDCGPTALSPPAAVTATAVTAAEPTIEEAVAFFDRTEADLLQRWMARDRAAWVQATYITDDTEALAAAGEEAVMAATSAAAQDAMRYKDLALPPASARKRMLLRTTQVLPAPRDPVQRAELAALATGMPATYSKAKVCVEAKGAADPLPAGCHTLEDLSKLMAQSMDEPVLRAAWTRWHDTAVAQRKDFERYVELSNAGARDLGFADLGELWRAGYDMQPAEFAAEMDRLWQQVEPLYRDLHCFARSRLHQRYPDVVAETGPIPAHLLGNMWAQDWMWRLDLLWPEPPAGAAKGKRARSLTDVLVERKTTPVQMVRHGEAFFTSLGIPALPETFWQRSLLQRPRDREVQCHASAWDLDFQDDLRIKMCIEINEEDFVTVHHELGHNVYQRAYKAQPPLFADSANDGFHEALGDTIALSVTPAYLDKIGLSPGGARSELNFLMQRAVEKVAFLPFGLLVDRWRWQVFSGATAKDTWNASWWSLRRQFQGVAPPSPRDEGAFDAAAKYHVAASVPYARYFLAHILQFQFHRALCKEAGHQGPLHLCSIHGSTAAGKKLQSMMAMGRAQPWPEALAALSGETKMDASAILDYFAPLHAYLRGHNQGKTCGW